MTKQDYQAVDIVLYPCASRVKLHDGTEEGADDYCIWDESEVKSQLSESFDFMIVHN